MRPGRRMRAPRATIAPDAPVAAKEKLQRPDANGRYGEFGGRFVPETLISALDELEAAYQQAQADPAFQSELDAILKDYVGRATPLYYAKRLSEHYKRWGGAWASILQLRPMPGGRPRARRMQRQLMSHGCHRSPPAAPRAPGRACPTLPGRDAERSSPARPQLPARQPCPQSGGWVAPAGNQQAGAASSNSSGRSSSSRRSSSRRRSRSRGRPAHAPRPPACPTQARRQHAQNLPQA
jgi:hypothetical protein